MKTKIIAHRGFSSIAPENTLLAFQQAIDIGVDYVELDVHKSADDVLVVIHNPTLDQTSSDNRTGKIADMKYAQFEDAKVGYTKKFGDTFKDEKLPTLHEVLELCKGKMKVCIEVKVYGIETHIIKLLDELKMKQDVIIFSFYYPVLAKFRELDPNISLLYLKTKADELTLYYAQAIKAKAIGVGNPTKLTKEFIQKAHQQEIEVWQWTVNQENEMDKLLQLGIDGIITDYPDIALGKRDKMT